MEVALPAFYDEAIAYGRAIVQVVGNGAVADELDGDGEPAIFGG